MDVLIALAICLIFIFILYSASIRDLNSCDFILFVIGSIGTFALSNGWDPKLSQYVASMDEGLIVSPDRDTDDNINMHYDPIAEMYDYNINNNDSYFKSSIDDELYGKSDFDNYTKKGYIPGYSDVALYCKDGRKPFSDPYGGATEEGRLRYGEAMNYTDGAGGYDVRNGTYKSPFAVDFSQTPTLNRMLNDTGSRGDNHSAQYNVRLQRRAKENMTRASRSGVRNWEPWLRKELEGNENRNWWEQDNLYDTVGKLL